MRKGWKGSKIRRFVPRDYFEVKATFGAKAGQYEGKWFDRNFKKSDDPEHKADRFWTREDAEAIVAACEGKPGTPRVCSSCQSSLHLAYS